jgi:subtilisin family serine protease
MRAIDIDACQVDASSVLVAVVDTGVDVSHPDLAGVVADYINCCATEPDADTDGHGTHVCGILAGAGTPPDRMLGACNARLIVYKGLGRTYDATAYYRALGEAVLRAPIVNLSLGGPDHDPTEELLIGQALKANVLVVAASGNDGDDGSYPNFPAALPGVLAVGAVDEQLQRADFSNAGPHLALVAPGVEIWSTAPTVASGLFGRKTGYAPLSGTSMAAPFVSAVAARVAASGPGAGTPLIRDFLPVRMCPGQTSRTDELGAGIVYWGSPLTLGAP